MKNLKFLGVLLVGLFLPILVNADTAVINDVEALKSCVETSDTCQLNADLEVKDINFNKGTIEIPEGKTLTISGKTFVSPFATIIVNGTIVIEKGAVLDASKMSFGATTGLIANQSGKLTVKENGTFIGLDYWEQAYQAAGGWSPLIGNHLFYNCEPGAVVISGVNTYVLTSDNWKGAIESNGVYYTTLDAAIKAATNSKTTIKLLADINSAEGIFTGVADPKNIVFDLNGKTLSFKEGALVGSTNTKNQNIHIENGSTIVFKNGNMISSSDSLMFLQNYCDLTLDSVNIDTTNVATKNKYYSVSLNNGTINIIGSTNINSKSIAFDAYWWPKGGYTDGALVTVNTTGTIKGIIEVSANSDPEESKTILKIDNINHEGEIQVLEEVLKDNVSITNGVFTSDISEYLADKENTKAILENGKYSIYEKFNIVGDLEPVNGTIELDKYSAFYKDKINIKVTPNEGYEIESISVVDFYNNEIKVENNKFIMPKTEAFVSVKFKPIQTVSTPVVNEENTVGVKDAEKTESVLLDTLARIDKYKDLSVTVELVVEDIEVDKKVDKEFNEALTKDDVKDGKIVSYFDISVVVKNSVNDKVEGYLTELSEKVEFKVALPELDEVKDGYTRNYYVIKKHGTTVSIIDANVSSDGKYIIFETDEFSTYALAYEDTLKELNDNTIIDDDSNNDDKKEETEKDPITGSGEGEKQPEKDNENEIVDDKKDNIDVPKTFDGIVTTLILGLTALISFVGISYYFKKELAKKNN